MAFLPSYWDFHASCFCKHNFLDTEQALILIRITHLRGVGQRYGGLKHYFFLLPSFLSTNCWSFEQVLDVYTLGICSKVDMYDIATWSLTLSMLWAQCHTPPEFRIPDPHSNKPHLFYFIFYTCWSSFLISLMSRIVLFYFLFFSSFQNHAFCLKADAMYSFLA